MAVLVESEVVLLLVVETLNISIKTTTKIRFDKLEWK